MPVAKPTLKDARQLVKSRLGIFQEKIPTKRATVGHSDGSTVDVEGKTDYIFVRIRGDDRAVWEVQNFKGPLVYNTPVIIKLVDAQKGIWAVDDVDRSFFSNVGGWGRSNLLAHAPSHEWPDGAPGEDPLNIYQRALVPLRAYPFDGFGLEIFVAPGIIPDGSGDIILYEGGSITIASGDLPISGQKRNALISLNMSTPSAPVVARTLGNPTVDNDSVSPPNPSLPADHIPLALVLLKNGDTQLTEDRFRDLRKIVSGIDSPGTTTFLGLTDTPSSFSGAGGYTVRVNSGATALEFVENEWTRTGTEIAPTNDADTVALYDESPTARITLDPGSAILAASLKMFDALGVERLELRGYALATQPIIKFTKGGSNTTQLLFTVDIPGTDPSATWEASNDRFQWNKGHEITVGDVLIPDDLVHYGDPDTLRSFTDDAIEDQAGGIVMLRLTETAQDLVEIGDVAGTGDVDVNINNGQVFIEGSSGSVDLEADIYPEGDGGGLFQRNVNHWRSPDDHFNAFSGWTWDSVTFNGAPSTVDVATYPSLLRLMNDSIAEDHFAYQSISVASGAGYNAYARLTKGLNSYVGIRLDNGDNNNFVECRIEDSATYSGQFRIAIRWRVGGGSITTTYGTDPLPPGFWLIQILKVSNSFYIYVVKDTPIPMYANLTTGVGNVFALSRAGIIFGQRGAASATDRVGLFDWMEYVV